MAARQAGMHLAALQYARVCATAIRAAGVSVVTEVRIQRLQEISIEDALAEGITHSTFNAPRVEYQWLWDSINAKRGLDWDKNPWVWALTFKVVPA